MSGINLHHRRLLAAGAVAAAATLGLTALPAQADLGAPTNTAPRTVHRSPSPIPRLVDIRTGTHAAYDRVVFELKRSAPGFDVRYVQTVRQDGSGKVLDLRGQANLMTRLTPADAHDGAGRPTYDGAHRILVDYPNLRDVRFAGDFEATVSVALGLRHQAGFRVFTLQDPTRIVVDVAH
jgi:hypothetical protein